MKVTFQDGSYRSKVYQQKYAADKIIIRYRINSDYECFDVRLFDPEVDEKPIVNKTAENRYFNLLNLVQTH